jgi:hypothetical protein
MDGVNRRQQRGPGYRPQIIFLLPDKRGRRRWSRQPAIGAATGGRELYG